MTKEIQVWRMSPSLRGSVEVLQLWVVILHKEIQRNHYRRPWNALERNKQQEYQVSAIEALKKHL
jgi:hypothetical protein